MRRRAARTLPGETEMLGTTLEIKAFRRFDMALLLLALVLVSVPVVFALAYGPVVALRRERHFPGVEDGWLPKVSVLVPARNEAAVIREKLSTLVAQDYPESQLEVLVGSDASDDATDALVLQAAAIDARIRLVRLPQRSGKAKVLNALRAAATGDVLVMTDASALPSTDAVREAVRALADPTVGLVTVGYRPKLEGRLTRAYWGLERMLRRLESERDALVGVHGAFSAFRRGDLPSLPVDLINDDYALGMLARAAGLRVRYLEGASVREGSRPTFDQLLSRRRRIVRGNVEMLDRSRELLGSAFGTHGALAWLHKLPRTVAPLFLLPALMLGVAWVALQVLPVLGVALTAVLVATAALAGPLNRFALLQLSMGLGLVEGLRERKASRGRAAMWETGGDPMAFPRSVRVVKRVVDVVGATVGLVLGAPLFVACAVAVRLSSKGPVIYSQERVGTGEAGRETRFFMHKFRTMRVDAESATGPVWAQGEDPRVTKVGKVLRKARLDELPQLWNVLVGEMSLVGPRPERPFFCDKLRAEIPLYDDRLLGLKPGVTGLAQIHSGYDVDLSSVRRKLLWDLAYAAQLGSVGRYLRVEAQVVAQTVVVMVTGRGAH